jgi:hypothetical protein
MLQNPSIEFEVMDDGVHYRAVVDGQILCVHLSHDDVVAIIDEANEEN